MSDIRFNQWLHQSGTGGVSQVDGGHVGIGTTNPEIAVHSGNNKILNVGIVTASTYYGDGSNLSGISVATDKIIEGDTKVEVVDSGSQYIVGEVNGSEKIRITSGGLVGINTASPDRSLHVYSTNGTVALFESNNTNTISQIVFQGHGASALPNIGATGENLHFTTGNTERLLIKSNGRLLVGTANEGHPAADELTIANTTNAADMGITLRSATNGQGAIYFSDGTGTGADTYRGIINYNHSNDFFSFFTNATEKLRIASNGDFGFNDTSPTAHASGNNTVLSIKGKGSSYSGKIDFKDSSGNLDNYINSDNSIFQFYCDPNSQNGNTFMNFYVHGGERFRFGRHGQLGIGGANYGNSGEVLTSQGPTSAPTWANPSGAGAGVNGTQITANNSTSAYNFTIPTTATRIVIRVFELQGALNSYPYIRVRNSGGQISSGYKNVDGYIYMAGGSTHYYRTDRFELGTQNWASVAYHWTGFAELNLVYKTGSNNVWYYHKTLNEFKSNYWSNNGLIFHSSGFVDCGSNPLTQVDILNSNGNFNTGGLRVDYYY